MKSLLTATVAALALTAASVSISGEALARGGGGHGGHFGSMGMNTMSNKMGQSNSFGKQTFGKQGYHHHHHRKDNDDGDDLDIDEDNDAGCVATRFVVCNNDDDDDDDED